MIRKHQIAMAAMFLALCGLGAFAAWSVNELNRARRDFGKSERTRLAYRQALETARTERRALIQDRLLIKNLYNETRSISSIYKRAWQHQEGSRFRPSGNDPDLAHLAPDHLSHLDALRLATSERLGSVADTEADAIQALDSWLYLRSELQAVNCPASVYTDAVPGILNVDRSLRDLGVQLVFCPIPTKWEVHPEGLSGVVSTEYDLNPQRTLLIERLRREGVWVCDLAPVFREALRAGTLERVFFLQDTHWKPESIDVAAAHLAELIRKNERFDLDTLQRSVDTREGGQDTHRGDLASMLENASRQPPGFRPLDEPYTYLESPGYQNVRSSILLTGRSFANIAPTANGKSIGLAPGLAHQLSTPIEHLSGGAVALRASVRRDPGLLVGKKIVIWTMPGRDFWESPELFTIHRLHPRLFDPSAKVTLPDGDAPSTEEVTVTTATLARQVDQLVYPDLISSFSAFCQDGTTRVYYYMAVRDRQLAMARFVRTGDRLRFRAIPWEQQITEAPEFGKLNIDDSISDPSDELFFVSEWINGPGPD